MKKAKRSLRISSGPLINYVLLKFKLLVYHFHLFEPIKKDASRVHSMLSHTLLFCLTVFFFRYEMPYLWATVLKRSEKQGIGFDW